MPTWLIIALVKMAVNFGLPMVLPHLPQSVQDIINAIFQHATDTGQSPVDVAHSPPAHIEKMCTGVGCAPDPVK